jgi:uncharacterized protein with HEPN domain
MSESTQRVSEDLKSGYPEIEWARISAFRNVLVHDYLGIDIERIWEITQTEVLQLKTAVRAMLESL